MSQTRVEPENVPVYRTPRWVKVLGVIALVLILLVAVVLVSGLGGEHSPGRHLPSADGGHTSPVEHSTQQP